MSERFGIEVKLKDGSTDWYDPCTEFPENVNGFYTICNSSYEYEIPVEDVESITKYDLCKVCEYDTRTFDCAEEQCYNHRYIID